MNSETTCPCCSDDTYKRCCEPAHLGEIASVTCEALMRSRYCAYLLQLTEYLINTAHPDARTKGLERNIESSCPTTKWIDLTIENAQDGDIDDKVGNVGFTARFSENGKEGNYTGSRVIRANGSMLTGLFTSSSCYCYLDK